MRKFRILSNGYTVTTNQELLSELFENQSELLNGRNEFTFEINWFNFKEGIAYYDNNGKRFIVAEIDHENKTVKLV